MRTVWRLVTTHFAVLAVMSMHVEVSGDVIERRGTAPPLSGTVIAVNDNGVRIRSAESEHAVHFVPWDRVRSVRSDAAIAHNLEKYLETAEKLWRARTRLERNDARLAEPLFEQLFEQYRGQTHETARVVAEGLLRCRLRSGANELAVLPALEVTRLRRAGVETTSYAALRRARPLFDDDGAICRFLPPVWLSVRGMRKLQSDLARYDAQGDEIVAAAAELYHRAVEQQLALQSNATQSDAAGPPDEVNDGNNVDGADTSGNADQDSEESGQDDASSAIDVPADSTALLFVRDLIHANAPDSAVRAEARSRLLASLSDRPQWMQAWSHEAIGRSLLRESGVGRQQRGLVHLLHLPARYAPDQPYIAGLALYRAMRWLEQSGRSAAAESLRDELIRRYPNHPVHHLTDPRTDRALVSNHSESQ